MVVREDSGKIKCKHLNGGLGSISNILTYCKVKDLTCVSTDSGGVSCVRGIMF